MSSRCTFVTSYIYDQGMMDDIYDVLHEYAHSINRNGGYFSGMIKSTDTRYDHYELYNRLKKVIDKHEYESNFNLVIIGDDVDVVFTMENQDGYYSVPF